MLTATLLSLIVASPVSVGSAGTFLTAQDVDPPVQLWVDKRNARMGEEVRVHVRTEQDGFLLVLHAEPDGRVRMLFPLDPRYDNYVRGDAKFEVRGRGDRKAIRVYASEGQGVVYAAYSRDPFRFDGFLRGDHWDYSLPDVWQVRDDAEADLTEIVHQMASGAYFDYDLIGYDVYRAHAYSPTTHVSLGFNVGSYHDPFWYGGFYRPYRRVGFGIGLWYDPFYYDPFYYDPFYWYYDPFYYRPYYYGYRPYYYGGTRVIYYGDRGYVRGGSSFRRPYTFKSPDDRYRVVDTRRRPFTTVAAARRTVPANSGRVTVSPTRQAQYATGRRLAPESRRVIDGARQPTTTDRATVRRTITPTARTAVRETPSTTRRVITPDRRTTDRAQPARPEATGRRVVPDNSARPRSGTDSRTVRPQVSPRTPTRAVPARRPARSTSTRATPDRATVQRRPSRPATASPANQSTARRATVTRSSVRTAPTREATPRRATVVRPNVRSQARPTIRSAPRPTRSSARPATRPAPTRSVRPSTSRSRPSVSRPSSSPSRSVRPSSSSRRSTPARSTSRRKP